MFDRSFYFNNYNLPEFCCLRHRLATTSIYVVHRNWNFTEDLPLTNWSKVDFLGTDDAIPNWISFPAGQKELVRGRCGGKKKRQMWNAKGSGLTDRLQSRSAPLNFDDVYVDSEKNFPVHIRTGAIIAIETSLLREICKKEMRMKNAIAEERQLQSQNEIRIKRRHNFICKESTERSNDNVIWIKLLCLKVLKQRICQRKLLYKV